MDNSGGGVNEVNLFDWGNFENQSRMLGEELTPDFSTQVTPEQMENRGKNPNQELNIAEMTREGEQVASAEQGRNPGLENAIGIVTVGATEMVGAPTVAQMSGVLPHDNRTTEEIAIDAPEVARDGALVDDAVGGTVTGGALVDDAVGGTVTGGALADDAAGGAMTGYRTITITRGDGGYGGPVTVTPTEERHKVLYMTGGSNPPEPLARIIELSGMEAVNGNKETCPDEEVALAIIDCGGTLRCGIYPGKGIPTINILATGKSGPLAKYMTEDLYVSAVTSECVSADATAANAADVVEEDSAEVAMGEASVPETEYTEMIHARETVQGEMPRARETVQEEMSHARETKLSEQGEEKAEVKESAPSESSYKTALSKLLEPVLTVSKVISLFQQAAREAVRTCLEMILPFMGFAALFIGICKGSGLTQFLAGLMKPMGGSLPGLMGLGIICSIPGLSAILGAGAVAAQMFSTVIGELIAAGSIPPVMALPALFAINCQCACDFIPVGLGMTEAKPETTQVGIAAVTISRFVTGWIRILIAVVFSIGLYR